MQLKRWVPKQSHPNVSLCDSVGSQIKYPVQSNLILVTRIKCDFDWYFISTKEKNPVEVKISRHYFETP